MANRLAFETSPYLLQHAGNPVDWYAWNEEALKRARTENKPIFLSIGYSACHWCHVMAHESFENKEIARYLNENFISIKVDREERPDLDHIYMQAVEAVTGGGGWPLTVFLTPDGKPFFGGTYFPPDDRQGMPGFMRVLTAVKDSYENRTTDVLQAVAQITEILKRESSPAASRQPLDGQALEMAYQSLQGCFDSENGGFGQAPKFPQPVTLEFLLRYHYRHPESEALRMAEVTLVKMASGGLYDQIGGGFHRYSTDELWLVPHFEKMLYDNALLARVYLHAFIITGNRIYRSITEATLDYVLREMTSPEGGFYSSQDADSEGGEGKYYVWTAAQIVEALGQRRAAAAASYFGVVPKGNFEGSNILHLTAGQEEPADVSQIRDLLLAERAKRVKPATDEKVLTSWNGMTLAALAEAAAVLDRDDYLQAAVKNARFLLSTMSGGVLMHTRREGDVRVEGFLEDYAHLVEGLLVLHETTLQGEWLRKAISTAEAMVERFEDKDAGLLFDSGPGHEDLFVRPRNILDGATPCGNSAAAAALLKVAALTGNDRFRNLAEQSLRSVYDVVGRNPLGFGQWLSDLDLFFSGGIEIAVLGAREGEQTRSLLNVISRKWLPDKVLAGLDPTDVSAVSDLGVFEGRKMISGKPTVYVCRQSTCSKPVTDPSLLAHQLGETGLKGPTEGDRKQPTP
jgi:uncharacterized protein